MIDLYTLSVLAFALFIGYVLYKDRKNIERKYYVLFIRRTKRFGDIISDLAKAWPTYWKFLYTVGVFVCLYYMLQGVYLLTLLASDIATGAVKQPGLQLILPTISATGSAGPGYILIPFWFWIITLGIILISHEFSHGVIARAEKVKLKSVGLFLLAIFPGAFVEPEDRQVKKLGTLAKLRIFSAGSFANFLIASTILIFLSYVLWPIITDPGIQVLDVKEGSAAALAGMKPGEIITGINGNEIQTSYNEYMAGRGYFYEELGALELGERLSIATDKGNYNVAVGELNRAPSIGIQYAPIFTVNAEFLMSTVVPLFTMIWILSFAVGLVNILPMHPLDGGLMFEAVAQRISKKHSKKIVKFVTYAVLFVLLYDFFGPFFRLS
ncbi:MAG TPA: site-2 protease family protein [archaeon]|nr:site-2 protease family protein [archaeon]